MGRGRKRKNGRGKRGYYPTRRGHDVYIIYVDGKTERWYFLDVIQKFLDDVYPEARIRVKPDLPKKSRLKEKLNELKLKQEYEEAKGCYLLIDFDTLRGQNDESVFLQLRNKKREKVKVVCNNPCLEFWFFLHFKDSSRGFENCTRIEKRLNGELKKLKTVKPLTYSKDEKGFKRFASFLLNEYKRTDRLFKAIKRAEKIGIVKSSIDRDKSVAEIFLIIEDILKNAKNK